MLKDGLKEFWYIIRNVESILYILLKVVSKWWFSYSKI